MMRKILRMFFVVALAAVAAAACSKDDKDGSVAYAQKALFLNYGESATIGFSGVNISSYSVSSVPTGWKTPEINTTTMTMTVTAPEADAEAKTTGSIVLRGVTHGGEAVSASLFVSLATPEIDLSDAPANCYIANRPNALYLFDATCKGDGSPIATKQVAVIWQTSMNLIRYLNLEKDGKASFFVEADDDDETIVERGNALIGGYDADGNLLWSWHIWITDFDPEADALSYGDYRVMSRQLGALQNGNADKDEIWNSYGLYYQWGRKDPFAGPTDWNASKGITATLFDGESNTVRLSTVALDAETGTFAYANAHPMHFITTATNDAGGQWLRGGDLVNGWSSQWEAVNDPCPNGWQVAPAAAFEGLRIDDDLAAEAAAYEKKYGWKLTNGVSSSFYFAAGRRIYADGTIQNLFDESLLARSSAIEAQPWVGYNWTSDATGGPTVFCFWFVKADPTQSGLRTDLRMSPANGMSVRCIRKR